MSCTILTLSDDLPDLSEYKTLQARTVKSLRDAEGLIEAISDCDTVLVALCEELPIREMLTNLSKLDDHANERAAIWWPHHANSFSDFAYRQLGGQIASLWMPLTRVGLIIAPHDLLLAKLKETKAVHSAYAMMPWRKTMPFPCASICWEMSDPELPVLEPRSSRFPGDDVPDLLHDAKNWLPEQLKRDSPDFQAVIAGLFQWFDDLDTSHSYSQSVQFNGRHKAGDYWHAIMHRREGDYSNSKYWFRNVGQHPLYPTLERYAKARNDSLSPWSPHRFVDVCEGVRSGTREDLAARQLQGVEMVLLLSQTIQDAEH